MPHFTPGPERLKPAALAGEMFPVPLGMLCMHREQSWLLSIEYSCHCNRKLLLCGLGFFPSGFLRKRSEKKENS